MEINRKPDSTVLSTQQSGRCCRFCGRFFPHFVTTTEQMGLAMLKVAKHGSTKSILESSDINAPAAAI